MLSRPVRYMNSQSPRFDSASAFLNALRHNPPLLTLFQKELRASTSRESRYETRVTVNSEDWQHRPTLDTDMVGCCRIATRAVIKPITRNGEKIELIIRISPAVFTEAITFYKDVINAAS